MRQSDRPEEARLLSRAALFLTALLLADPLDWSTIAVMLDSIILIAI